ncbi:MAG TPA: cytochrome c oxidase assembly protein [Gemmatimonadaceae bacterium]|nr:cytochrome c oxidase assembly protein [Gemmatimonadaceae bacterium]
MPRAALAHAGAAPEPHDLWSAWTWSPTVLAGLALGAWLYARGLRALWRRAGRGRVAAAWRVWCWYGGLLSIFIALVSPVDAVGEALFAVHMVQHMLLMMVAAPLIVLGDPVTVTLWALPLRWRRRLGLGWRRARWLRAPWRVITLAPVAWTIHVFTLWIWHAPSFFERALNNELVHELEHATFFLTAMLFWWLLFAPRGHRLSVGAKAAYLFAAMLQGTILGAVITFARHPWYWTYFGTTKAWGLTPLEDQQLAGLIMWIPAGLIYLVALIPIVGSALVTRDEPRVRHASGPARLHDAASGEEVLHLPADAVAAVVPTTGTP